MFVVNHIALINFLNMDIHHHVTKNIHKYSFLMSFCSVGREAKETTHRLRGRRYKQTNGKTKMIESEASKNAPPVPCCLRAVKEC